MRPQTGGRRREAGGEEKEEKEKMQGVNMQQETAIVQRAVVRNPPVYSLKSPA